MAINKKEELERAERIHQMTEAIAYAMTTIVGLFILFGAVETCNLVFEYEVSISTQLYLLFSGITMIYFIGNIIKSTFDSIAKKYKHDINTIHRQDQTKVISKR